MFLQGRHGVGKSTLLHQALSARGLDYSGYLVQRVLAEDGTTRGFGVQSLHSGQPVDLTIPYTPDLEDSLFVVSDRSGGRLVPQAFLAVALPCLRRALEQPPALLVLDELGGMELLSEEFRTLLDQALAQNPVLGTFKAAGNLAVMQQNLGTEHRMLADYHRQLTQTFARRQIALVTLEQDNHQTVRGQLEDFLKGL